MSKKICSGVVTALVSPLKNNEIDWDSLDQLVSSQLKQGVDGFVINGTTGESPSLSISEVQEIYKFVKKRASDKTLILGAGTNSTDKTIALQEELKGLEPDAFLAVVPYYNKPTQEGLYAHFSKVADNASAPVILYNVPARTLTSLSTETVVKLGNHKNIVGIKEASGAVGFMQEIKSQVPEEWTLMSGDDETSVDFVSNGGDGCISVLSHLCGDVLKSLYERAHSQPVNAQRDFEPYLRITKMMGVEPNPIPVKWALYNQGIIASPECRLPLMPLSEKYRDDLAEELKKLRLNL